VDVNQRARAIFEDRYGQGAFERLLAWLEEPCVTFAEIANRFGVSRERVRQWHQQWQPEAPTGRVRQRLCAQRRRRQAMLSDSLVRAFLKHARTTLARGRIRPIPTRGGYRTRELMVDRHRVALRDLSDHDDATQSARSVIVVTPSLCLCGLARVSSRCCRRAARWPTRNIATALPPSTSSVKVGEPQDPACPPKGPVPDRS
jgi:hypothetical protein